MIFIYLLQMIRICVKFKRLRHAMRQFVRWCRSAVSPGLAGAVCLQLAMAASEPLHKFFHADADEPGHECAVTLFAHGQVDASPVDVPVVRPVARLETAPTVVCSLVSAAPHDLPPGRAPPAGRAVV